MRGHKPPNNTFWKKDSCRNSQGGERRISVKYSSLTDARIQAWGGKGVLEGSPTLGNRDNAGFQVTPCLTPWVEVCNVG